MEAIFNAIAQAAPEQIAALFGGETTALLFIFGLVLRHFIRDYLAFRKRHDHLTLWLVREFGYEPPPDD